MPPPILVRRYSYFSIFERWNLSQRQFRPTLDPLVRRYLLGRENWDRVERLLLESMESPHQSHPLFCGVVVVVPQFNVMKENETASMLVKMGHSQPKIQTTMNQCRPGTVTIFYLTSDILFFFPYLPLPSQRSQLGHLTGILVRSFGSDGDDIDTTNKLVRSGRTHVTNASLLGLATTTTIIITSNINKRHRMLCKRVSGLPNIIILLLLALMVDRSLVIGEWRGLPSIPQYRKPKDTNEYRYCVPRLKSVTWDQYHE